MRPIMRETIRSLSPKLKTSWCATENLCFSSAAVTGNYPTRKPAHRIPHSKAGNRHVWVGHSCPTPLVLQSVLAVPQNRLANLPRHQGNRRQRRQHSYRLATAEVFMQKESGQQHGDGGVEGTEHDRIVEASGLGGANKEGAAGDVDAPGKYSNRPDVSW